MRKLKLQVQISLDGFIAGPNGEMDWLTLDWGDDLKQYVQALTEPVDCIVLGRKLAQGFIPHWAGVAADTEAPEHAAGQKFTATPKVVFSHTLTAAEWPATTLATGELATEIRQLKAQPGQDMIAYGGASFVASLVRHNLIDEYHLFVNPVALGRGLAIFAGLDTPQQLQLVRATSFACGITALHYKPARPE